jgi:hypothetical protein
VCTHGGIRSGSAPNLNGIILGGNSPDLARKESPPLASVANWRAWANETLDFLADGDASAAIDLHPLCLNREPSIYLVDDKYLKASAIKEWLIDRAVVCVYDGLFEYEDYDEMSRDTFKEGVKTDADVVFLPYCLNQFSNFIRVQPVNYIAEFEKILQDAWGCNFDHYETDEVVGHVADQEIERPVHTYTRGA